MLIFLTMNLSSVILLSAFFLISCGDAKLDDRTEEHVVADEEVRKVPTSYVDGTWCADVEYYNPETGTRSSYDLDVEVEDDELTKINWPYGGWLDGSHFSAKDIIDGECSFTCDKGYEYTVTLSSEGGCGGSGAYRLRNDIEEDRQSLVCPLCGDKKYHYDDLCSSCERKKEEMEELAETCPKCNGYKMESEPMCSSCKDEKLEEETNDNEN
jgi:hypothetical protein